MKESNKKWKKRNKLVQKSEKHVKKKWQTCEKKLKMLTKSQTLVKKKWQTSEKK